MSGDLFGFERDETAGESDDTVTLTLVIHGEFNKSFNVSETGDGRIISLPRSEITIAPTGKHTSGIGKPKYAVAEITMPEWLAKDRGLV